ncbi:MAG: hypothetical protein ACT4P6_07585 [Gemmatimonadaceae bacterium]
MPFAPDLTIRSLRAMRQQYGSDLFGQYAFIDAFNPTFGFLCNSARDCGTIVS